VSGRLPPRDGRVGVVRPGAVKDVWSATGGDRRLSSPGASGSGGVAVFVDESGEDVVAVYASDLGHGGRW